MTVVHTANVNGFLSLTADFRSKHPLLTNTTSTAAAAITEGPTPHGLLSLVVVGSGGAVTGYLLYPPPWPALIPPMTEAVCTELVAHLDAHHPGAVHAFAGPVDTITTLTQQLPDTYTLSGLDNVRELRALAPKPAVAGHGRAAEPGDEPLIGRWLERFHTEAHLPAPAPDAAQRLVGSGRLRLWVTPSGEPVSMGARHRSAGLPLTRIGGIYTPDAHRGHGYATAISWLLADELQREGLRVMLYAEADNPASNHIYAKLGFETVAQTIEAHRST